ncbi:MAG: hypothetical protein WCW16_01035 [Candidatus Magasanikbacteria bacterium]
METRKENILKSVVESYIDTAEPVGSKFLVEKGGIDASGATVRNDMRDLEEEGFLTHPHTSAGRIPTEMGYQYYVDHVMKEKAVQKKVQEDITALCGLDTDKNKILKSIGKYVADVAHNAVIIAFSRDSVYYTGMSHLFAQPEFQDMAYMVNVSTLFDHCEERIEQVYDLVHTIEPNIFIGTKNPLGILASTVVGKIDNESLFAILGPTRMNYAENFSFIDYIQKTLH